MFSTSLKAITNGWILTVYNNLAFAEEFYERLMDAQEARLRYEYEYEYDNKKKAVPYAS